MTEFSNQFWFVLCFRMLLHPKISKVIVLQSRPVFWRTLYK